MEDGSNKISGTWKTNSVDRANNSICLTSDDEDFDDGEGEHSRYVK
jgi:hypothetical protein